MVWLNEPPVWDRVRDGRRGPAPTACCAWGALTSVSDVLVGVMAASPDGAGFDAVLRDFRLSAA